VTAGSGYRVNLGGSGTSSGNVSVNSLSGIAAGGTGNITAQLSTGRGVGAIDELLTYTFADDSVISGALANVGTAAIHITGTVYNGQGVWNTNGNGSWADFSKWTAGGGAPGLDAGFSAVDTALFGRRLPRSCRRW